VTVEAHCTRTLRQAHLSELIHECINEKEAEQQRPSDTSKDMPKLKPPPSPAAAFLDALKQHMEDQKQILSENEGLVADHYDGQFHMRLYSVGSYGPDSIILRGNDDKGNPCCLFSNVSSARLITTIVKIDQEETRQQRIGFTVETSPSADTSPRE
jgi:hypothetical protein